MDERAIEVLELLARVLMAAAVAVLVLAVLGAILRLQLADRRERLPRRDQMPGA